MTPREYAIKQGKQRLNQQYASQLPYAPAAPVVMNGNGLVTNQNSGFIADIDTLTGIKQRVVEQKFYELGKRTPADYVPITVGENAFADDILTYKTLSSAESFEQGIIDPGTNAQRYARASAEIQTQQVPTKYWADSTEYNIIELARAQRSGNWSLIEAYEKARYKRWQLGIQQTAFLGLPGFSGVKGLLTLDNVTANTTVINKFLSKMTDAEFKTALEGIVATYTQNTEYLGMPTHFVMPLNDFQGLARPYSDFPGGYSRLQQLIDSLRVASDNENLQVMPLAYSQKDKNKNVLNSGTGFNRYAMYRHEPDTIRMDIPVDYTTTAFDTIENFTYYSVAYGQFTGVEAYRPNEVIYFDHTATF